MLKRAGVDHILRAAAAITDHDRFVVLGTGAVIATAPNLPLVMMMTSELDLYADGVIKAEPLSDMIDVAMGRDSLFHRTFGYYGDGVGPETAILPAGWRDRASEYRSPAAPGVTAICPDAHDIAVAKLCAWREKDQTWLAEGLRHGVLDAQRMAALLAAVSDPRAPPAIELERRLKALRPAK